MHERVQIDRRTGLRAGAGCPDEHVDPRVFERFAPPFLDWALTARRSIAPLQYSPFCPETEEDEIDAEAPALLRIAYPLDGARFSRDPGLASPQAIRVRVEAPPSISAVRVRAGSRVLFARAAPFFVDFPLAPGEHRLRADADGALPSAEIGIFVE